MITQPSIKPNRTLLSSNLVSAFAPALDTRDHPGKVQTESAGSVALEPTIHDQKVESNNVGSNYHCSTGVHREAAMDGGWLVDRLKASPIFREYQHAFEAVTGLPLTLRPNQSWQLAHHGSSMQEGFCAWMAQANHSRAALLAMQQQICDGANGSPCTRTYPFGIVETAVGVKVNGQIIACLLTGQVFVNPPTKQQTRCAVRQINAWQPGKHKKEAIRSYRSTRVIRRREYQACIRLLVYFAGQLGDIASQMLLKRQTAEPVQIARARQFIENHYREKITLADISRLVGMCTFYFCKKFKQSTGVNYTEYVSRVRVEQAKKLLLNQNHRVTEVCFEVGFQSLTHFNRCFKRMVGHSPKDFRRHLPSI